MVMYAQIINIISDPLAWFFGFVAPFVGIYVSYLVARSLHKKFYEKNFGARVLLPALLLGLFSIIFIALSGFFAENVADTPRLIRPGMDGLGPDENQIGGLLTIFYGIVSIPVGLILTFLSLSIFGKKTLAIDEKPTLGIFQKFMISLFLLIFIGTFLLYLPIDKIAPDIRTLEVNNRKAERISKASENEYVCGVYKNEITHSIVLKNGVVYNYYHNPGGSRTEEVVGRIEGVTFIPSDLDDDNLFYFYSDGCYNSKGENFKENFSKQLIQ